MTGWKSSKPSPTVNEARGKKSATGNSHDEKAAIAAQEPKANKKEGQELPGGRAYFTLLRYATPVDLLLRACGAIAACGAGSALPLMTLILGNLINDFNDRATGTLSPADFRSSLNKNALWFVYLFIAKFVALYFACVLYCITAARMTRRIRLSYLDAVLHQPISYFDHNTPGTVATSLSTDTTLIEVGLAEKVAVVFEGLSMIVTSFIIAFTKNWKLSIVVATSIPYMMITTGTLGGLDAKLEARQREFYSKSSTVAEEALSSITTVTALGAIEKLVTRFDKFIKASVPVATRRGPIVATIYGNMYFVMQSSYALSLFYGVKLYARGEIKDGGTVITVLFSIILGSSSFGLIAPSIPSFIKAAAAAQKVMGLLQETKSSAGGENGRESSQGSESPKLRPNAVAGHIQLNKVTFTYPSRAAVTVLNELDLDIPAGKVTAIVGHSGSGKSTLVAILERWYDLTSGSISLDGVNINRLDIKWWRGQIGLVQQEPMLFNDTIRQNVLNGLLGERANSLGEEEKSKLVINACRQANAHEFIEKLPNGYETEVGERADLLSGGQKQRIAIARSIISDPKILLLDEATSALDAESERAVQAAFERICQKRTTIMIAHKLSTIEKADKIVVLDKGRFVEEGTHELLLAKEGLYCRLLRMQKLQMEDISDSDEGAEGQERVLLRKQSTRRKSVQGQVAISEVDEALESKSIGRRIALLQCVYVILCHNPLSWPYFFGGMVGTLIAGAAFPAMAVLFSRLVTVFQLSGEKLIDRGNFWSGMFFMLGCTNLIAYAVVFLLLAIVSAYCARWCRLQYFRSLLSQDVTFFQVGGNSSGKLTALLGTDSEDIELLFGVNIGLLTIFIVNIISCCILALAVAWKLALVTIFSSLPALLLAGFLRMRFDTTAQDRCAGFFLESARFASEAVGAIRTVSSLTLENSVAERYGQRLNQALVNSSRGSIISMIFFSLSDTLDLLAMALGFWYGGRLVSFGEITVTKYFIAFMAIIFGGQAGGFTIGYTNSLNKSQAAANRMLYIKNRNSPINSSTGIDLHTLPPTETAIEFRNVHFRYPTRLDVEVLRGLNLQVRQGENVCIVGLSGCGKSTIVSLLERYYDISSGEILVHGMSLSSLDIKSFRSLLGLVSQETTLYLGTVRENLLIGVEGDVSEEKLIQACRDANIHDFITSLPEGYDTDVGPRGQNLSGGQRQRMAIARALVRDPEILLFDEATSALDPENEALVRDALDKASRGRTMIDVTHQTETMKKADCIFVLDHGRVVEKGQYQELLDRKGRFWRMLTQGELQPTG